jgi:hypothetical protein
MEPPRCRDAESQRAAELKRAHRRGRYDRRVGNPFARIGKFSAKTASTRRQIATCEVGKRDRHPPIASSLPG